MNELDKKVGWGPFNKDDLGTQQREIYVCTFSLIALLVGSDGDLSKEELQIVSQLIKQTLKLDEAKKAFVQNVFNETKRTKVTFLEMLTRYKKALSKKPDMYRWLLDVLMRLALADGVYTEEEHELLKLACKTLGLPEDRVNKLASEYGKTDLSELYNILGLKSDADSLAVENSYEKLMSEYNVNKLIELGFAQELVQIAQERQSKLMEAYLGIRKSRE